MSQILSIALSIALSSLAVAGAAASMHARPSSSAKPRLKKDELQMASTGCGRGKTWFCMVVNHSFEDKTSGHNFVLLNQTLLEAAK